MLAAKDERVPTLRLAKGYYKQDPAGLVLVNALFKYSVQRDLVRLQEHTGRKDDRGFPRMAKKVISSSGQTSLFYATEPEVNVSEEPVDEAVTATAAAAASDTGVNAIPTRKVLEDFAFDLYRDDDAKEDMCIPVDADAVAIARGSLRPCIYGICSDHRDRLDGGDTLRWFVESRTYLSLEARVEIERVTRVE
ncbi:hypothetical protein EVG20_g9598 [Dentipellis fragilis]|uniref:Uncharacterized protein n=1 Tax=Dentipellis fragilis TaxID=205917 RepID=A0A4Y9XY45_9AGAM|nr:hypothetical protein EVG20_g9598 [Dentipellis fragilis]